VIERLAPVLLAACLGCRSKPETTVALPDKNPNASPRRDEPPVPLNAEPPVSYPEALAAQRLGGSVILRLFVDSTGKVVPDSTAVQESSGYPALDSAALAAVPKLRYAPGLRNGTAIGARFLQPFNFRPPVGATPP
jgi:TonB family protein